MTRLTDDALAAIRARANAATDGPWTWDKLQLRSPGGYLVLQINGYEAADDTAFIAAARTDVPALLAEVDALRLLVENGDSVIEAHERDEEVAEDASHDLRTERDTLAAKLAEVERERDEARRSAPLRDDFSSAAAQRRARLREVATERDAALAEQRRLAAEVERITSHRDYFARLAGHDPAEVERYEATRATRPTAAEPAPAIAAEMEAADADLAAAAGFIGALCALPDERPPAGLTPLAAPQPPAVDREASLDELARLSQEFGGYEELREQGNAEVASAIRALPDEEPPSGMIERVIERSLPRLAEAERQAEVRRCEAAVVEAAEAWRDTSLPRGKPLGAGALRLRAAIDALRAAREKAGV